jgi:hypothetical protein
VAFDFVLYDLRALGKTRAEIEAQRIPIAFPSRSLRLSREPWDAAHLELKTNADGACVIDGIPPGSYFLRIAATSPNPDEPCYYLPQDLELELAADAYRTVAWMPRFGGELHVDFRGSAEGKRASLLDASGKPCPVTFLQQGPGLFQSAVGGQPMLSGPSVALPALPADVYTLRIEHPAGPDDIPITIESGRVTRLAVNLDEL